MDKVDQCLEWANKRLELQGKELTDHQLEVLKFVLKNTFSEKLELDSIPDIINKEEKYSLKEIYNICGIPPRYFSSHIGTIEEKETIEEASKRTGIEEKYIYDHGFGPRTYTCTSCKSHKLVIQIAQGSFSPPSYICDDCNEKSLGPRWNNL